MAAPTYKIRQVPDNRHDPQQKTVTDRLSPRVYFEVEVVVADDDVPVDSDGTNSEQRANAGNLTDGAYGDAERHSFCNERGTHYSAYEVHRVDEPGQCQVGYGQVHDENFAYKRKVISYVNRIMAR